MGTGMVKLDAYPSPPGCCVLCRGDNLPVVDTGMLEEDMLMALPEELRGHVFICHHCISTMGQLVGQLPASAAERITAENARLENEVAELRDEVARWSAMARSMARALPESEHPEVQEAREEALAR